MQQKGEGEAEGPTYLEPHGVESHVQLVRMLSSNDSGIVEYSGNRFGSRVGLSVPNDCYLTADSDQEACHFIIRDTGTPRLQRMNSHPPLHGHPGHSGHPPLNGHPPLSGRPSLNGHPPLSGRPSLNGQLQYPMKDRYMSHELFPNLKDVAQDQYEELPGGNSEPNFKERVVGSRLQLLPQTSVPDGGGGGSGGGGPRRRDNPIFGPPTPPDLRQGKRATCSTTCCLQGVPILLALVALAVAVVGLVRVNPACTNMYEELLGGQKELVVQHQELERKYEDLAQKYAESVTMLQNLLNKMTNYGGDNITGLQTTLMADISTVAAPNLRGLVNMSGCNHRYMSKSEETKTDFHTGRIESKDGLILGVTCTARGLTTALLIYDHSLPDTYECGCSGALPGHTGQYRKCEIHYWLCPKLA